MEPAALALLLLLGMVAAVALLLAVVNRRARRWRFGVFYERDDRPPP